MRRGTVLVRVSLAVMKQCDQRQHRGERVYFAYDSTSLPIKGSQAGQGRIPDA